MPRVAKKTTASKSNYKRPYRAKRTYTRTSSRASSSNNNQIGSSIGSAIGSAFGPAGGLLGGALGSVAQQLIRKVTGYGDYMLPVYNLTANKLLETNDPPIVQNDGKEFIIRHREYICDIYSGVAGGPSNPAPSPFKIEEFAINPGLLRTFPWLANVASRFEEYNIQGMLFEYKSMYSDAAVQLGGSLGSVIMATAYNASKPVFASKIEMENYEFAMSAKPSQSMCHPIECARSQTPLNELYVRTDESLPANEDKKTYDLGKFQIASQGIPVTGDAASLGELWVTYQIRFLKPRISDYVDSGYARYAMEPKTQPSGGSFFDPNPLTSWVKRFDNIGVTIINKDSFTIPLRSNKRVYQLIAVVSDPSMTTTQNAAIGYPANTNPLYINAIPLGNGLINNPTSTMTSGSVILSGGMYTCFFETDALAPGKIEAKITLPAALGAGFLVMKNLILHAVPRLY